MICGQVVARRLPVNSVVNASKAVTLTTMGAELDRIRRGVWARFSGAKTAALSKRQVRDRLMAENAPANFDVPQRLWRATVEDTVDKIRAWQQAVIATEVRPKICVRTEGDKVERKRLLGLAKTGHWLQDPWLSRQCRSAFAGKRPRSRRSGRIVADNCSYDVQRDAQGRVWLAVMTPTRGARLRLNLGSLPEELVPTSTIEISRYTPKHEVKRILTDRAGTVENCPTTTQAPTSTIGDGCERNNPLPERPTSTK